MGNQSISSQVIVGVLVTVISAIILTFIGIKKDGGAIPENSTPKTGESYQESRPRLGQIDQGSNEQPREYGSTLGQRPRTFTKEEATLPIKNLFSAWQTLSLDKYMDQWKRSAVQISTKYPQRNYSEIYAKRQSFFPKVASVNVDQLHFQQVTPIESDTYLIIVEYSMAFHLKSGKTINEHNIAESYVVVYDYNKGQFVISANYDYVKKN